MRFKGVLVAVAAALVATPAAAEAANICVGSPAGPCPGIAHQPTAAGLQAAIDQAETNNEPDTIRIGPGVFVATTAAGFSYSDTEQVEIVGSGSGQTVLAAAGVVNSRALSVLGNSASRIADMTLQTSDDDDSHGLNLRGTAERIVVDGSATGAGVDLQGIRMQGPAVLRDSLVSVYGNGNNGLATAVAVTGAGTHRVERATLLGDRGVTNNATGALTVTRTRIEARRIGLHHDVPGATIGIDSSIIGITNTSTPGTAISATLGTIREDHVTVYAYGNTSATTPYGAYAFTDDNGQSARIETRSSIHMTPTGFAVAAQAAGGTSTVTVLNSRYTGALVFDQAGPANLVEGPGSTTADPRFVAPPADLRLRYDSPLIDKGAPLGPVTPDFGGLPRVVGAARDIGAHEYQRRAPVPLIGAPATVIARTPAAFAAGGTDPDPLEPVGGFRWSFGDGGAATGQSVSHTFMRPGRYRVTLVGTDPIGVAGTVAREVVVAPERVKPRLTRVRFRRGRIAFTLSEDADVKVTVQRRVGRRWRKAKAFRRRGLRPGRRSVRYSTRKLRRGLHRLRIVATDTSGNRSKTATVRFRKR